MSTAQLSDTLVRNHRLAALLGTAGAATGFAAGVIQLTIGSDIPQWTGAKSSPAALGLLTMALSVLAGFAALRQRDPTLTTGQRTACTVAILGTALLCATTVGWLWWWLPAPLLFAAASFTVDSGKATLRVIRTSWTRCLLTLLGAFELLMAASAGPLLMVVGGLGGVALIAAAWLRTTRRSLVPALVLVGTVPFAVLGWTAIAPLLVLLVAVAIAVPLVRRTPDRRTPDRRTRDRRATNVGRAHDQVA